MRKESQSSPTRAILQYQSEEGQTPSSNPTDSRGSMDASSTVKFPFTLESIEKVIKEIQLIPGIRAIELLGHEQLSRDYPGSLKQFYQRLSNVGIPIKIHGIDQGENYSALSWLMSVLHSTDFKPKTNPLNEIKERVVESPKRGVKRKRNGWFDPNQIRARHLIIDEKIVKGRTNEEIKNTLNTFDNNQGIPTIEGGEFQVTTIARFLNDIYEIAPKFVKNKQIERRLENAAYASETNRKTSSCDEWENMPISVNPNLGVDEDLGNYGRYLILTKPDNISLKHPTVFNLIDGEGDYIYSKVLTDDHFEIGNTFTVDLIKDTTILPGRYFWELVDLKRDTSHPAHIDFKHSWEQELEDLYYPHSFDNFLFGRELVSTPNTNLVIDEKNPDRGMLIKNNMLKL